MGRWMLNIANARAVVIVCCLLIPFFTFAADVRLFHAGSFSSSLAVLLPEFERNSGHKVVTISGTAGSISDRVEKGEPADVVLLKIT
jgi:molybdate transport system substrate-binding protein